MTSALRTFARLTAADRARLAEAFVLLACVRIGLRMCSFGALQRRLDRRMLAAPAHPDTLPRITWAVAALSRRLPGTTCLAEALTACTMLRRHGHTAVLRIGTRHATHTPLDAHAWVECDGAIVIGRVPEIQDYAVLT